MPSRITAVSALKQRELAQAIKRARFIGLMPYAVNVTARLLARSVGAADGPPPLTGTLAGTAQGVSTMKVILLERVGRMGQIGDEVTVKDGFARNFLLPQQKALRATEANRKPLRKRARAHREAQHRAPRSRPPASPRASTARPS